MRAGTLALGVALSAMLAAAPMEASVAQSRDCVRTVRAMSDFTIRGDAWMWWHRASGQYERDHRPEVGAVLVFKRSPRLGRGHVSLVSRVIDGRTIEVDHTWLEGEGIRRGMKVVDISLRNDWTVVRVWHEPSDQLGIRTYPTYGFILPEEAGPRARLRNASVGETADEEVGVAPRSRSARREAQKPPQVAAIVPPRKPEAPALKPTMATMVADER